MQLIRDLLRQKGADVVTISPEAGVDEAVQLMAEKGIGSLIVMQGGELCGIVTERDYTRKIVVGGRSAEQSRVIDIMTPDVLTTGPGANVDECMMVMTDRRIRHLPVVDDGRVVGMISIGDLMVAIITDHAREIDALEQASKN
jgi:CBS domain-containing protein